MDAQSTWLETPGGLPWDTPALLDPQVLKHATHLLTEELLWVSLRLIQESHSLDPEATHDHLPPQLEHRLAEAPQALVELVTTLWQSGLVPDQVAPHLSSTHRIPWVLKLALLGPAVHGAARPAASPATLKPLPK